MNPVRKKRLTLILAGVFGIAVAVALVLYSLQQNINLFFTPTQMAAGEAPLNQRMRAGGMVVEGSVKQDPNSLLVTFGLTDFKGTIDVQYEGILPDLFREGQGIVAQGTMSKDGMFVATQVLAKHDEKYMPPEVQDALDKAGKTSTGGDVSPVAAQ